MDWILPLIAGIFILFGTGLGFYITYKSNSQSNEKQQKIESLNLEISEATKTNQILSQQILDITNNLKGISGEIQQLAEKNIDLTDKGLSLTEKSIELSEIIQNIQTGGDSYPEVSFVSYKNNDEYDLLLINRGQYIIRNASVRITDYQKRHELMKIHKDAIGNNDVWDKIVNPTITEYKVGNILPNVAHKFHKIKVESNTLNLTITIFSESGVFTQKNKWIEIGGIIETYTNIKDRDSNTLYEKCSQGFPRKDDGTPNLNVPY
tara:strand:+ start:40010 stop:40801 length:792 start_codon:yes stop_codon:yes gene_type:complete